jgi:hypothetical protein
MISSEPGVEATGRRSRPQGCGDDSTVDYQRRRGMGVETLYGNFDDETPTALTTAK